MPLRAETKTPVTVTGETGNAYLVSVTIDDDPFTNGIQVDNSRSLKQITVSVTLASPTPGWQTAVPATVLFHRVRGN